MCWIDKIQIYKEVVIRTFVVSFSWVIFPLKSNFVRQISSSFISFIYKVYRTIRLLMAHGFKFRKESFFIHFNFSTVFYNQRKEFCITNKAPIHINKVRSIRNSQSLAWHKWNWLDNKRCLCYLYMYLPSVDLFFVETTYLRWTCSFKQMMNWCRNYFAKRFLHLHSIKVGMVEARQLAQCENDKANQFSTFFPIFRPPNSFGALVFR